MPQLSRLGVTLLRTRVASLFARLLSSPALQATASAEFASSIFAPTTASLVLLFLTDMKSSVQRIFWRQAQVQQRALQRFKLKSKKFNKTFMLGIDDDGNLFSLDSSLDIFFDTDDGDYDDDSTNSPGEAEMTAVYTDVDSSSTPTSADRQADLIGVISPPVNAQAAWTDDHNEIDMHTDPTVPQCHRMRGNIAGHHHHAGHSRSHYCYSIGLLFHPPSPSPSCKPDANLLCIYLHCGGLLGDSAPHYRQQLSSDVRNCYGDYSNEETTLELRDSFYVPGLFATLLPTKAMLQNQGIRTYLNNELRPLVLSNDNHVRIRETIANSTVALASDTLLYD
eukprot:4164681-Pleurochrysis_carterae.AAC.2